jgi:hypothetical protein
VLNIVFVGSKYYVDNIVHFTGYFALFKN